MITAIPPDGWRVMKFVSDSGRDMVQEWLTRTVPIGSRNAVRIELETVLRYLRMLPIRLWTRPQFAWLQGDHCAGIGEIILDYDGVPYRPLVCLGPQPDQFTILMGARKDRKRKGHVQWDPENALYTARNRQSMLDDEHVTEYVL